MLAQINALPTDIVSLVVHCNSEATLAHAKDLLISRFNVSRTYFHEVSDMKELARLRTLINVAPLLGSKWVLWLNVDILDMKALLKQAGDVYDTCLIVYYTERYGTYRKLCDAKFVKDFSRYCPTLYGNTFSTKDIQVLMTKLNISLDEKIVKQLATVYRRSPEDICNVCKLVASGYYISSEKDLIDIIGLGNTSVAGLLIMLLTMNPKSPKGRKATVSRILRYLDDLARDLSWSSIQNFILDTLAGFIDIKVALVTGALSSINSEPPERFNDKRAARYKRLLRYRYFLRDEVSLEKLIVIRGLYQRRGFSSRNAILIWLFRILDGLGCWGTPDVVRRQVLDSKTPIGATFNFDDYNQYGDYTLVKTGKLRSKPVKTVESVLKSEVAPEDKDVASVELLQEENDTGVHDLSDLLALLMGGSNT